MGRIDDGSRSWGWSCRSPFAPPPGVEFKFDLVHVSGRHRATSPGTCRWTAPRSWSPAGSAASSTLEQGYEAARLAALSIFASLERSSATSTGSRGWVKALGLVQCAPGFDKPPAVINGFTDLVLDLWGTEAGRHARSAIGAAQLPFDVPVEIEAIVEIG